MQVTIKHHSHTHHEVLVCEEAKGQHPLERVLLLTTGDAVIHHADQLLDTLCLQILLLELSPPHPDVCECKA